MSTLTKTITATGAAAVVAGTLYFASPTPVVTPVRPVITKIEHYTSTALTFTTESNFYYRVLSCTNISSPNWTLEYGEVLGDGSPKLLGVSAKTPQKFYMILKTTNHTEAPPYPPMPISVTNQGTIL